MKHNEKLKEYKLKMLEDPKKLCVEKTIDKKPAINSKKNKM